MKYKEGIKIVGTLTLRLYEDNKVVRTIKLHNLVTDLGRQHLANQLSSSPSQPVMSYMAIGSSNGQDATSQTLATETARVVLTRREQGSGGDANKVVYEGYFDEGVGTGNVSEAGIFNSSSGGTMLSYASFGTLNKTESIALKITWEVGFMSS